MKCRKIFSHNYELSSKCVFAQKLSFAIKNRNTICAKNDRLFIMVYVYCFVSLRFFFLPIFSLFHSLIRECESRIRLISVADNCAVIHLRFGYVCNIFFFATQSLNSDSSSSSYSFSSYSFMSIFFVIVTIGL